MEQLKSLLAVRGCHWTETPALQKIRETLGKSGNGPRNQGSVILLRHLRKRIQSNMTVPKNGYERRGEYSK